MPYNSIEELAKKIKPAPVIESEPFTVDGNLKKPSPLTTAPANKIFDLPKSTDFADKSIPRYLPGGSQQIVGGATPDYSGYEDVLQSINKLKPRDTSTADLVTMGLSTGLGAMFGQTGAAAKVAGEYGLSQSAKADKRADSMEDLLLKLQMAKAAKMAAGKKGTKLSSGDLDAKTLYKMKYIDPNGIERNYRHVDSSGAPIADENDPVASMPTVNFKDKNNADGSSEQLAQMANQAKSIGSQNAKLDRGTTANGETYFTNDRTVPEGILSDLYNKTSTGLTKYGSEGYNRIAAKRTADPVINKIESAYNDIKVGMSGLQQGGISGAKIANKMFASALEKGNRTTDFDVQYAKDLNAGLSAKIDEWLSKAKEGDKMPDALRAELEEGFAVIEAGLSDYHDQRTKGHNRDAKTVLQKEWRDDLAFPALKRFDRKNQDKLLERSMDSSKQWMSSPSWVQEVIVDGKPIMRPDGTPMKAKYIMKNGKPYALQEVR